MCLSRAAFSLARLHVTRATIGGPLLLVRSKSIWVGARRRFVEIGGSGRRPLDPNVVIVALSLVGTFGFGLFGIYSALFGLYFAISNDFGCKIKAETDLLASKINGVTTTLESKINGVTAMLESKLDGQDRKLAGQDRKVDGFGEKIDSQDLKYERKKSWGWFGLYTAPVEIEDRTTSKVTDNLDAMVDAKVIDSLDAMLKELKAKTGDKVRVNDNNSHKK